MTFYIHIIALLRRRVIYDTAHESWKQFKLNEQIKSDP